MDIIQIISWSGYLLAIIAFFYGKSLGSKLEKAEIEKRYKEAGIEFIKDIEEYKAQREKLNDEDFWDYVSRNVNG